MGRKDGKAVEKRRIRLEINGVVCWLITQESDEYMQSLAKEVGELLAATGAVKDDVLDRETLAANLLIRLRKLYPEAVNARYKLTPEDGEAGWQLLEAAAKKRGFLAGRGEYDTERMAAVLLDEFRGGKLGRMSLEAPDEA